MEIIKLQKNDIEEALHLVWRVFQQFVAPDYSEQGVEEFKEFISYKTIIEKFDKGELYLWGCIKHNDLVGIISTMGMRHICMLFVDKEYQRQGIAKSLFQAVEENCKRQKNVSHITVNASPYAVEAYHRLGFVDTDKEQMVNGIRFTPMSYLIKLKRI